MNIAIFGGSFDPPHLGHAHVAKNILDHRLADEVWFLPVGQHAFDKHITLAHHRTSMLEVLSSYIPQSRIELYELNKPGVSVTYRTLLALQGLYPQHSFSFVMGSDNLGAFHLWHNYQQLIEEFPVLVYPRAGFLDETVLPGMQYLADYKPVAVSSTLIKDYIKKGKPFGHLLPRRIEQYIMTHGLYEIQKGLDHAVFHF